MRSGWVWVATSALAGSTLALSVAPAAADWQYAQWGMNPDQVVAASNEAAQPSLDRSLDIGDLRAALTAPYRIGSVPLMAVFLFDPKSKLQVVTLKPGSGDLLPEDRRDPWCPPRHARSRRRHGAGQDASVGRHR